MESFALGAHNDFRLFMSAEPAATPTAHIIPQGILESSIKITNEPPTGMQVYLLPFYKFYNGSRQLYNALHSKFYTAGKYP